MPLVLFCRHCEQAYRHLAGVLPSICPNPDCGKEADWMAVTVEHEPRVPFRLSVMDRRFLKAIRIQADEPEANG